MDEFKITVKAYTSKKGEYVEVSSNDNVIMI
jgi:hypothetical protein